MMNEPRMNDVLRPPPLEDVALTGPVGEEIDRVIAARMSSRTAREEIVPEAVAAFRNRVDDRLEPGRGLWQGEFWGKWVLSAVAAWRYTGDKDLLDLIRWSTAAVIDTRRSDGYIGTYHDSGFVVGDTWNVWCRKYTLWGLLEAYGALGDERVLEAAAGLMDHLIGEVGPGRIDIVGTGNFYGLPSSSILTPVLELYRLTREPRYLDYASYITEQWSKFPGRPPDIIGRGLTGEPVHLWFPEAGAWTKAYEFISCVEGLLGLFRLTGQRDYLEAARNIHRAIRDHERVITGGIGGDDKLLDAASRPDGLNEPCDVVYWERLNLELLRLTGAPEYADEIERLAWNVLMAVVNRDGSWALRRLGLSEPHLIAVTHCRLRHHHCCVANIPRGLLQLAQAAVMSAEEEDVIAVNLFLPGTARLVMASGPSVTLNTETRYPEEGTVRIRVIPENPVEFTLRLRILAWSSDTSIRVNDAAAPTPPGVPVTMTSPATNSVNVEQYAMSSANPKTS